MLGAYSDTWAHHHLRLTSIVTPFHAVVFGGLGCGALFMAWALLRLAATPRAWRQAIPRGYTLTVAGYILAVVAGPLDLTWHYFLGIDQGFGSVTSPTHMLIGIGVTMLVTGPLLSAWSGGSRHPGWPALLSATLAMAMLLFFDEATHPFLAPWASPVYPRLMMPDAAEQIGTIEIVMWATIVSGCILPLVLRFKLPFGALTMVLGATGVLTTLIVAPQPLMVVGLVGGLLGEELLGGLRPSRQRALQLRLFAFLLPALLTAVYFALLASAGGIWWPVTVWSGCIAASGIAGLLVSMLLVPAAASRAPGPGADSVQVATYLAPSVAANVRWAGVKPLS